jgi:ATP-dependent DNA helicase DinG
MCQRSLSNVIITRLPFAVPIILSSRRVEAIEARGGDSFREFSLPKPFLNSARVGRLIRTKTDTGIIVVLDNRVLAKAQGDLFSTRYLPARRGGLNGGRC